MSFVRSCSAMLLWGKCFNSSQTHSFIPSFPPFPSFPILRSPGRADGRATPRGRASIVVAGGQHHQTARGSAVRRQSRRRRRHCFHFERADGRTDGLRRKSCASVTDSGRTDGLTGQMGRWGGRAGVGWVYARSLARWEGMTPSGTTTAPAPSGTPRAGVRHPIGAFKGFIVK